MFNKKQKWSVYDCPPHNDHLGDFISKTPEDAAIKAVEKYPTHLAEGGKSQTLYVYDKARNLIKVKVSAKLVFSAKTI
jgi:hypothetical protein